MRFLSFLFLMAMSFIVLSQCGNRYNAAIFPNVKTTTYQFGENITYTGANQKLNLDLYTPIGDTTPSGDLFKNRPCIVFCFGGAFVSGTRTSPELTFFASSLAQRGFVCASIDYRLDNQANMTANGENGSVIRAVQDAKAAVRFLKSKSADFGIDSTMMFIGGTSAGGVTALTLGYSQFNELSDSVKTAINSLGGWEGSTNNLSQSSQVKGIFNFAGAILDTAHIVANDLPIYLNHANGDATVPFRSGYPLNGQSKTFMHGSFNIAQRMKEKGNYYVLDSFSSTNHPAFADPNILTGLGLLNTTLENLRKFLYKVMKCDQATGNIQTKNQASLILENPVKSVLYFNEEINLNDISLYNLLGNRISLEIENSNSVSIRHLPRGLYILKYKDVVQKLIFE